MILFFPELATQINVVTQQVFIGGTEHKVRPKTFELLKVLIEANGELVTKDTLLQRVWSDVVVDEQVIFQSIKELRKLFPEHTVIKTVPRKGYAWLPKAVEKSQIQTENVTAQPLYQPVPKRALFGGLFVALVSIMTLITLVTIGWLNAKTQVVSGSIVVLPVQSDIEMNDHDWVRYGVMDQVISRLNSTERAGVLQTDYVLEVITRAKLTTKDIFNGNVTPIFDVSGAELILAMRLTGSPNDYQIVYTLYQRDGIEKGVIFDGTVQEAADQVAIIVGQRISPDFALSQTTYKSSFSDRLIAEALEAKSAGNNQGALDLLKAAKVASPDNLVATRLLLQSLVETGAPHSQVLEIATPALRQAQQQHSVIDQIRLTFWLAVSESFNGNQARAFSLFDQVEQLAEPINDWLYLAYTEELRGQLHQLNKTFTQADHHFQQAMQYHDILHCPLGKSNTLLHLSRLAHDENNQNLAIERAQQALGLIQSRKLSTRLPIAQSWLLDLKNNQNQ